MTYFSLFYIAVAFAQEITTQANNETTSVEPEKNNCKFRHCKIELVIYHGLAMWALISIVPGIVIVMVCAVKQSAFKCGKNGKKCG